MIITETVGGQVFYKIRAKNFIFAKTWFYYLQALNFYIDAKIKPTLQKVYHNHHNKSVSLSFIKKV